MLLGFIELICLETKGSESVMVVACEELLVNFTESLEFTIGLVFSFISEYVLEKSTPSGSFFANILDLVLLFLFVRLHGVY